MPQIVPRSRASSVVSMGRNAHPASAARRHARASETLIAASPTSSTADPIGSVSCVRGLEAAVGQLAEVAAL